MSLAYLLLPFVSGNLDTLKVESVKDTTEIKKENYSFFGKFAVGKNIDFRGGMDFYLKKSNLSVRDIPLFSVKTNNNNEEAGLENLLEVGVGGVRAGFFVGITKKSYRSSGSLGSTRNEQGSLENGMYSREISELEISEQKAEEKAYPLGLGIEIKGKNEFSFQIGKSGNKITTEDKNNADYNEIYSDSTNEQGIETKTDLTTRILTEVDSRIKIEEEKTAGRIEYIINKPNLLIGFGSVLQSNTIESRIVQNIFTKTSVEGTTQVVVGGDTIIIPFSSYEEQRKREIIRSSESINTDYLSFLLGLSTKTKKVSYLSDIDACFFSSNKRLAWKNYLTISHDKINVGAGFDVSNNAIGGSILFLRDNLPEELAEKELLKNYFLKKRKIDESVILSYSHKELMHEINFIDFIKSFLGPFVQFEIKKTYNAGYGIGTKVGFSGVTPKLDRAGFYASYSYDGGYKQHEFSVSGFYGQVNASLFYIISREAHKAVHKAGLGFYLIPNKAKIQLKKKNK